MPEPDWLSVDEVLVAAVDVVVLFASAAGDAVVPLKCDFDDDVVVVVELTLVVVVLDTRRV